jgi:hypothetical protein
MAIKRNIKNRKSMSIVSPEAYSNGSLHMRNIEILLHEGIYREGNTSNKQQGEGKLAYHTLVMNCILGGSNG